MFFVILDFNIKFLIFSKSLSYSESRQDSNARLRSECQFSEFIYSDEQKYVFQKGKNPQFLCSVIQTGGLVE